MKRIHALMAIAMILAALLILAACGNHTNSTVATGVAPTVTFAVPEVVHTTNATSPLLPANSKITIVFSKKMNPATITTDTITLSDVNNLPVAGSVLYDDTNRIAIFTPTASLTPGVVYTITVKTGVKDLNTLPNPNNTNPPPSNSTAMAAALVWKFTADAANNVAPTIDNVTPADAETEVALSTPISINFNKAMDSSTITAANFTVAGGGAVEGFVAYNPASHTATFYPKKPLIKNTVYTATLTAAGVKDICGNALAADMIWSFTTGSGLNYAYVSAPTSNSIYKFQITPTFGNLSSPSTPTVLSVKPAAPISTTIDATGRFLFTANKDANTISRIKLNSAAFDNISSFKGSSAPETVAVAPDGRFAYSVNSSGSTISLYTINNTTGSLTAVAGKHFATGAQPTSMTIDSSGRFAYVTNYAANSVSAYTIDAATGVLSQMSGSPYTTGSSPGNSVLINTATGKMFLYVTNNNQATVSVIELDPITGARKSKTATHMKTGTGPYGIVADPTGACLYVANFTSNNVSAFKLDPNTGTSAITATPYKTGNMPRSLAISPDGAHLYVANSSSNSISIFNTDNINCTLSRRQINNVDVPDTPIPAPGKNPFAIAVQ